ncbi:hypothetical protein BN988_01612 [Oceanobacillus picturae]|uniref:Uncharacterized protein n=1 Tax=Oceanobacillus picturae TaxID=171693 RepID=W9AJP7_9BACI|nr:hypothetical protein [Oceanobacillus picturae]CDO03112.1 hypothetical protein BN988_01612 [Oceanobacillus picturae]
MGKTVQEEFKLRWDHAKDITTRSLVNVLTIHEIPLPLIKEEMVRVFEENVNNNKISTEDAIKFVDQEIRYGYNRTIFCKDLDKYSVENLKNKNFEDIKLLLRSKGWEVPEKNELLNVYLPDKLVLTEFNMESNQYIELTLIETIRVSNKNSIMKENNIYFVRVDLLENYLYIRMRPRGNAVELINQDYKKIPDVTFYKKIRNICEKMLGIETIDSTHFKTTLYKIAKELTEKAEEKSRTEVNRHIDKIERFAQEMASSLNGFETRNFDMNFRLRRLFERALIQSDFKQLKQREPGKKGFINAFHFSDRSGGKVKARSKEKERSIDLSEIYYDTRDTIDQQEAYDNLWVNWFMPGQKNTINTRLEANNEFYQVHFYKYLYKGDLEYVLSEIGYFKDK